MWPYSDNKMEGPKECLVVGKCKINFYGISPDLEEFDFMRNLFLPFDELLPEDATVSVNFFRENELIQCEAVIGSGQRLAISKKMGSLLSETAIVTFKDLYEKINTENHPFKHGSMLEKNVS